MKVVTVEKLTKDGYAPYGEFYQMDAPDGHALCGAIHRFYPDRVTAYQGHNVGFSAITVQKPKKMLITQVEYHTTTAELIMPLSDDMILHVAQPSGGTPITDQTKAFLVPKHTLIKMNAGVWHLAPLPANAKSLSALIVLPECTYMNDCTVVDLTEEQQFIIEK